MKKANKHIEELKNKYSYRLSICMIVRDEEKFLDNCLKSLKPLVDLNLAELIVVDTGSIDKTIEIAKKYTSKVYFKEWNNNFSEARNYSISLAQGEYIFIMDADQEMEKSEVNKLIELFSSNEYRKFNTYSLVYKNFTKEDLSEYTYFSLNLIFKNDGAFRYDGKIHNQPIYKEPVKNLEIYMMHYGYIMTEDIKEKKFKRTATLLKSELEKDPNNIYYIYQLSRSYEMHGDTKEAIIELEKYLPLIESEKINESLGINYYHNATIIYFNAKEYNKCIYYCEKMKELDEELIDCYYLMGKCYLIEGNLDRAVYNLKMYLNHLNTFKYEKYASTNGLEVFSYGHKLRVISELLRLKIKINQLENVEEYINKLNEDKETYMLMISEILKVNILKEDIPAINKVIKELKKEDETILLYYLLSKIVVSIENTDKNSFIEKLNLDDEEREIVRKKINLEIESSFKNLLNFIDENSKSNKVIKIENCIEFLIDTLNDSSIDDIVGCNYKNEIVYIIGYLLEKSDMIINSYLINQEKLIALMGKYILIFKDSEESSLKDDREFSNKIDNFNKFIKEKNILESISSLKEAITIKPEFSSLITVIKDSIILEHIEDNNLITENDIAKIKENLITLINNNMLIEAIELLNQLEELYNIKKDAELISIKATLKFYSNEVDEAEKILKDGLRYYSKNMDLLYNLAYIYEVNNKHLSSMSTYYDILEVDSNNLYLEDINSNLCKLKEIVEVI
ncbi:hypothetical protein UT300007_20620 [Clostridium sp. CTA-7]